MKISKNLKKSVTPIIAVIMLLLITLSLAGMAMMIFTQIGKSSQVQLQRQLSEMNIKGDIYNAKADPNSYNFSFYIINYANIKLPIDNKNSEIRLNVGGVIYECKFDASSPDNTNKCVCRITNKGTAQGASENDYQTGLYPGNRYEITCDIDQSIGEFSVTKSYTVQWIYLGEGGERLLDEEPIEVGKPS